MRIARWVHQCRVDQTKETHAFTCADELLGDLKTHQAAKRMPCKKIGVAWLSSPNFKDVIGSHRFDRARDVMRSVQRRRLQTEHGPIAPQSAEQMSVIHHETISVVHEEKRLTFAGRAKWHERVRIIGARTRSDKVREARDGRRLHDRRWRQTVTELEPQFH